MVTVADGTPAAPVSPPCTREAADADDADDPVDEAAGYVDYDTHVSNVITKAMISKRKRGCVLTGAELGGTTLPVSETVQPAGRPGIEVAAETEEVVMLLPETHG